MAALSTRLSNPRSRFSFPGARALVLLGVLGVASAIAGGCQSTDKAEKDQTTAQLAQLSNDNQVLSGQVATLTSQNAELQNRLVAAEQARATAPALAPERTSGARERSRGADTVITMAGDVSFSPGSADLTAAGRRELDGVARRIQREFRDNRIRIEGFTDKTPIRRSKWGSNEALSEARAQAVGRYLSSKGVSSSRIESIGRGATNLKATDAASRRVEIHILGN